MNRSQIEDRVKSITAEVLGVDKSEINTTAKLIDELNVGSLELAELLISIDTEFNVHISDEEAQKIHTIEALVDHIFKKINNL